MNKQKLSQYRDLVREVNFLKKKIESDVVEGSNNEFPYEKRKFTVHGVATSRYDRKLRECNRLRTQIEEFIDSLDDSKLRMILELRYIEMKNWRDIDYFFGNYTGTYSKKIHDRYFKNS